MLIRKVAATLTVLEGLWIVYVIFYATRISMFCPSTGCGLSISTPLVPAFIVGILLVVDSVPSFLERWFAFYIGALLSIITIILVLLQLTDLGTVYLATSIGLSAVALIINGKAAISQPKMSEENHPLNLPVFG